MSLPLRHRQAIENLEHEIAKSVAADESATVNSIRESSEVLRSVDPALRPQTQAAIRDWIRNPG